MRTLRSEKLAYWLRLLEVHDPYTVRHSLRVRAYALRLAAAMGLERGLRLRLGVAGMFHDLGKLAIPRRVLAKPGRLTDAEFRIVRRHPEFGERLIAAEVADPHIRAAVRSHHERYGGGGYPDGLRGEGIPLLARILTVADCYDALRSDRPYRPGCPHDVALDVLRQGAGSQFDPELADVFVRLAPAELK